MEIVGEVFAAVERGDADGVVARLDPEVVWRPTGFITGTQEYTGEDGVREWLRDVARVDGTVTTFPTEVRALDDERVLVLGSGRLERRVSPIDQELGWIWELRKGKVTRMTNYLSHDDALAAAESPKT